MSTLTIKWLSMKLCWREAHSEVSHASLYAGSSTEVCHASLYAGSSTEVSHASLYAGSSTEVSHASLHAGSGLILTFQPRITRIRSSDSLLGGG